MCRLLGLNAGQHPVSASFWLLEAPDSLQVQSHRNVDGSGIGFFDSSRAPVVDKQPEPAFADQEFVREARQARSVTFLAHVRYATAGNRTVANTHPFAMGGRIMAHNGGFGELGRLEEQLGRYQELVQGDTDSERYFALITQQTDANGGDVGAGIAAAARWIAERLPLSSLNTIVATAGELWALRYPGQHALPSVVVASERLDGEQGWRMLAPGELVHVRPDLTVESAIVIPEAPAHLVPLPPGNLNIDT
jgi:glutamine amidotransferase